MIASLLPAQRSMSASGSEYIFMLSYLRAADMKRGHAMTKMDDYFDVVIVGTGAAGLYCALNLPERMKVLLITKRKADESDSFLAQGGICMQCGEADYEAYMNDTLSAGHYENDVRTVDLMIRSSNSIIRDLIRRGVRFARRTDGSLDFTREGAHSRQRILFHEDITGKEITQTLLNEAISRDNIELREYTAMLDIVSDESSCGGIIASGPDKRPYSIGAGAVVLCCGGIGGLYKNSTNFPHITGDAIAIAMRHGVAVKHLDYIQIHPTTLFSKRPGRRFLISESVRGEGALLYDKNGQRFTNELQPRDILSGIINKQMEKDGTEFVYEDMRPIGEDAILKHFPNILERCEEEGYDALLEPIPVVPAQHYFMGGISSDLSARTSMPGLYACGETCCNGVHGRNRLASNSLLESLVFAQRAADDILFGEKVRFNGHAPELSAYAEQEPLFEAYKNEVLNAIDKMRSSHE